MGCRRVFSYLKKFALQLVIGLALGLASVTTVWAAANFIIEEIEVEGADRVSAGTVLNYLPINAGEEFEVSRSGELIRALYDTGLFEDVRLGRSGDILVVVVQERPAISKIEFSGNKLIDDKDLEKALESMGIARGRVFNRSFLEELEQELRRVYFSEGYYALKVSSEVERLDRNRIGINIEISEGENAQIRKINILGNQAFDDDELLDLMDSGVSSGFEFWSSADQYSRAKLSGDLERLRSFYLDRGYVRFDIVSTQVSISDDKRDIFITVNVTEGEPYKVASLKLSGKFPVPEEELYALLTVQPGQIFSRQAMTDDRTALSERLEADGYAFANINVIPEAEDTTREVNLTFFVDPGKRAYVRRITFTGHEKTQDNVFRREMRQFEGGWYSPAKINRSRVRLQRLRFVESVKVNTERIAGSEDQIDINFEIAERSAGSLSIGAGYSSSQGFLVTLGLTHDNVFGTGNRVSVDLDNSQSRKKLSFSFTDPYFTDDGVSQTYKIFGQETDAGKVSSAADYVSDSYGASLSYGIPFTEFTTVRMGLGAEHTKITDTSGTPQRILDFLEENGDAYDSVSFTSSVVYDTRNRTIFAEKGQKHTVLLESVLPDSDIEFYKLGYDYELYHALSKKLVLSFRTDIDYGDGYDGQDELPFYEKYFAGGVRSLRGYEGFSLGPRDEQDNVIGGDFRTISTLELIFPPPWADKPGNTRFSLFYDIGNVYADYNDYDAGELRSAAGISFNWLSPIGPLVFSWAEALDTRPGDETEKFQFSIGTLF